MADDSNTPGLEGLKDGNKSSILILQQFGIDWLYDLELQQNNLFYVSQFYDPTEEPSKCLNLSPYFRAKSIKLEGPTINFKWNPNMRLNVIDNVDISKMSEVSITWIEDVYKSVYLYHLDWFHSWYNPSFDYLPIGATGKFRNLEFYVFHFIDDFMGSGAKDLLTSPNPTAEWLFKLTLHGMSVKSFGATSMNFDMGQSQSTSGVSANYSVNQISLSMNKEINNTFYLPRDSFTGNSNNYTDLFKKFSSESNISIF